METNMASKRYNMVLPEYLYSQLQDAAKENSTTVVELLRKFIKLGLVVLDVTKDPGAAFVIRQGDTEREIMIL